MRIFVFIALLFLASCDGVDDFRTKIDTKAQDIRSQNTVTDIDALEVLIRANQKSSFNNAIFRQSVAQVVFPKIVKASFVFGANYGEGFLIRDGEVVALIDLSGGNLGPQMGAQSYSQVTYILSEKRYNDLWNKNRMSLNGSISLAVSGQIQNAIMTTDAIEGDLYTIQFNETGSIYGVSLEGLYYKKRNDF